MAGGRKTEDCMMDAMHQEPGCGWRYERQRTVWWRQCVRSQDVVEVGETED